MDWSDRSRPFCTVDAVIVLDSQKPLDEQKLVLIQRAKNPVGLALPGGHVEYGESLEEACKREVMEECGIPIDLVAQIFTYSLPDRDPRSHTMSTAFLAIAEDGCRPEAGDDAADIRIMPWKAALEADYAFDHAQIVYDAYIYWTRGVRPSLERA